MGNKRMPFPDWDEILEHDEAKAVSMAFKSLQSGTATEGQQKYILDFLINKGCRTYDFQFYKNDRDDCRGQGIRYVGFQIVRMINLKVGKVDG